MTAVRNLNMGASSVCSQDPLPWNTNLLLLPCTGLSGSKVRLLARAEKSWELMVVRKSSSPGEHFSPPLSHSPSPGVFYLIYDLPAAVWRGFSCFFYPLCGLICNPFLWPACGLGLPWLFSTQPLGLPFNFIPDTKHLTSFSQGIALLSPTHLFKT